MLVASSGHRSIEDPNELNGGPSLFTRDGSPLPRDSPRSDISFHRRRLSTNLHSGSVDHNRSSLLCPPRDSAPNIVHQSISLDQLPHSELRLEVPSLHSNTVAASPSSSEPMLSDDRQRGVNFCPSASNEEEVSGSQNVGENHPMLKIENMTDIEGRTIYDDDNSTQYSEPTNKRSTKIWSRLTETLGIFQYPRSTSRITSNKLSLNGLKRESLV
ncbi:hypothetical protein SK128_016726 [Halocaridina rubra]|uniref:Uncharacterized protein n=1 Tax=Halocaridina rubra TaxID=373956 RepID=A0AAN8WHM5_HALRR